MVIKIIRGTRPTAKEVAETPAAHVHLAENTTMTKEVQSAMTWKRYGVSALNAFISAAGASAGSGTAASLLGVNAMTSLKIAGATAVVSGGLSFFKWISQHPLPGAEQ